MQKLSAKWAVTLVVVLCGCDERFPCDHPPSCDVAEAGRPGLMDAGAGASDASLTLPGEGEIDGSVQDEDVVDEDDDEFATGDEVAHDASAVGSVHSDGGTNEDSCVQHINDIHCSDARPSCDFATERCRCRSESRGNILNNPGFDGSVAGWSNVALSTDAEACTQSNSAALRGSGDSANTLVCVTLPRGVSTYHFGGKFRGGGSQSQFSLSFWSDTQCSGTRLGSPASLFPNATLLDWKSASLRLTVPYGATALLIQAVTSDMYMDQVYINIENRF